MGPKEGSERSSALYRETPYFKREAAAFGRCLRQIRQARRLTLEEVAERSGLDAAQLQKLEMGKGNVSLVTLSRLAVGLGQPIAVLFGGHVLEPPFDPAESLDEVYAEPHDDRPRPQRSSLVRRR